MSCKKHLTFPKVVLAHIVSEVDTLYIVLLSAYAGTGACTPTVIEIGLYLTDS